MRIIHNKLRNIQIKEETKKLTAAILFVSMGTALGSISQHYGDMQKEKQEALNMQQRAREAAEQNQHTHAEEHSKNRLKIPINPKKKLEITSAPLPYQAEVSKLNLAYFYPEGADTEDMINSYAGQVFQELTVMDSEWLADLYELADVAPAVMASRLGKDADSIKGNYNPRDNTHQSGDPTTWTIHDWKKIHVQFVDGDGKFISGFSNVKDILSMASVYTYYQDWMDAELFSQYSRQLWKDSHGYALRMSDVYYCDGCLSKTEEELVREAEEDELTGAENQEFIQQESEMNEFGGWISLEPQTEINGIEPESLLTAESVQEESAQTSTADFAEPINSTETSTEPAETIPAEAEGESLTESLESQAETVGENPSAEILESSPEETLSEDIQTAMEMERQIALASFSNALSKHSTESLEESNTKPRSSDSQDHFDCPGHVDLFIQVKVLGLQEKKGLFSKDSAADWKGWTEENIGFVHAISNQDWFADYGLSVSSICLSNPLTHQEIEEYMRQLPSDLSKTRRDVIHFALSSVGRVPYYWGGKASAPGYEGNNFGALIPADYKGRMLRGLDCSGWINWVYWSATGQRLAGESTSSLILCGEQISRSQLKPGDIIVRTGTSAHVVMFLSWSANGQMNVIHESSAPVNNVTIKTMDAPWPYYRKLVE